jgi:hypothetical protein
MVLIEQRNYLKFISLLISFFYTLCLSAQWYFFALEMQPKEEYSLSGNAHFLSNNALMKRQNKGLKISNFDYRITEKRLIQIASEGHEIVYKSKWLNTVVVVVSGSEINNDPTQFKPQSSFILNTRLIEILTNKQWPLQKDSNLSNTKILTNPQNKSDKYGFAADNTDFLGLRELHDKGFIGKGVDVYVFDGGFTNVHRLSVFDSMRKQGRFLGEFNHSLNTSSIYASGQHGTQVLSCMAAFVPHTYMGTGYGANYGIMATETGQFESPLEEWAYIEALEHASELGVDLIQSSLGYTTFDSRQFGHFETDLINKDIPIIRACSIASQLGILLVNSAGNEGNDNWHYVGFPAVSPDVIAVAAATSKGEMGPFSSYGYISGSPKPDATAIGVRTKVISGSGYIVDASGTSFAAPSLAGAMTCMIQLFPNKMPDYSRQVLCTVSSHSLRHHHQSGYGIPNLSLALFADKKQGFPFFTNSYFKDTITSITELKTFAYPNKRLKYCIKNGTKDVVASGEFSSINAISQGVLVPSIPAGSYTIVVKRGLKKWKKCFYFAGSNSI